MTRLPAVIGDYVAASDVKDIDWQMACFADDAVVVSMDDMVWVGADAIRRWRERSAARYGYRFEVRAVRQLPLGVPAAGHAVFEIDAHLAGGHHDDPRRNVRFRFELHGDLIRHISHYAASDEIDSLRPVDGQGQPERLWVLPLASQTTSEP